MEHTKKAQSEAFQKKELELQRSEFDMSHKNVMTCNFNKIIPINQAECMPGDKWKFDIDFFSRWLTLSAPTFNQIDLKFNNFFCSYQNAWRGFAQFMGLGDSLSADYLLQNADTEGNTNPDVPYFTTQSLVNLYYHNLIGPYSDADRLNSRRFPENCKSIVKKTTYESSEDEYRVNWSIPSNLAVTDTCCIPGYSLVNIPILARKLSDYTTTLTPFEDWVVTPDQELYDDLVIGLSLFMCHNSLLDEIPELNKYVLKISSSDSGFNYWTDTSLEECSNQYKYTGAIDVFFFDGYELSSKQITELEKYPFTTNFIKLPQLLIPFCAHLGYNHPMSSFVTTAFEYNDTYTPSPFPYLRLFEFALKQSPSAVYTKLYFNKYHYVYPIGYARNLPYQSNGDYSIFTEFYDFNLKFGSIFIHYLLGKGTLADYLGMTFDYQVHLPVDDVYNKYIYNISSLSGNSELRTAGTYNDNSAYEFVSGVVSNKRISLLPFLCYHQCWNNFFRDPRFEEQYFYANPYKSVFLTPQTDGTYIHGNLTLTSQGTLPFDPSNLPTFFKTCNLLESVQDDNHSLGSVKDFLTLFDLHDRRCVKDYWTLLTPKPQFGDDVLIDGSLDDGTETSMMFFMCLS